MGRHKPGNASKTTNRNPGKRLRRATRSHKDTIDQLRRELDEGREQQTATAEVLKIISGSTFNLQTVLDTLVETATRLCHAQLGVLSRRDGDLYRGAAYYGYSAEFRAFYETHPIAPGRSTTIGRTALEGKTVHIPDVLADPEYTFLGAQKLGQYRANVGVPLLREGKPIGALSLARAEPLPFSHKQIELVEAFAAQAVIALENTRLLSELRESLQQQTATAEVLKVISRSTFDLQTVLDTLTASAARLCQADKGAIFEKDGDVYRLAAHFGFSPKEEQQAKQFAREHPLGPGRGSLVGRVAMDGRVVQISDVLADAEYQAGVYQKAFGFRSNLGVPLLREGAVIGVFALMRMEVNSFTEKEIELVSTFADQAVIAIENVRLFDEVQARTRELSESLEQQTATSEVLSVISSSAGELQPVFDTMLAKAVQLCEASFGAMWLVDGVGYRTAALHGDLPEAYVEQWRSGTLHRPKADIPMVRAIRSRKPVHVTDTRNDKAYLEDDPLMVSAVEIAGIRTLLAVPMLKEGEAIGLVAIYRKEMRAFSDKQIELVSNFAKQAVIAIENTRLLSELRESLQQQTATADVLKVISRSTFDLGTVLQTLVESAARLCDADKTNISRQKDGVFFRAESYGFSPEFMDYVRNIPIQPDRGSAFGRALLERRAVHIPDVKADSEYTLVEGQRLGDYRTVLAVPMLREGVAIGVLSLTRSEVRPFSEKQIELATTFADQAAIAIENVRLFESVEARTRELARSLEDLRTTQDRLVQTQKLASLGQLTAGIAHEIKNPLNFVNNFSGVSIELIDELRQVFSEARLDGKLRAEISEIADTLQGNLDKVVQHGKRADAIVKNMLLHSREGSGEHRPVDINALVEEGLNLAYHGARAEKQGFNIKLEKSFDPNAGEADVFPQDITRVLLNLISNGFYAATKRQTETNGGDFAPTLSAATKNRGNSVEISIRDNGTGIPPEVKDKIFNPFFTTKPAGKGTGLGLSISHDIVVKQHGGSIEVDTELGEFTEIRITLPRAAALFPEPS